MLTYYEKELWAGRWHVGVSDNVEPLLRYACVTNNPVHGYKTVSVDNSCVYQYSHDTLHNNLCNDFNL